MSCLNCGHLVNQADSLTEKIESLCDNPDLGFPRADIKPGYRQLEIEKHHVFIELQKQRYVLFEFCTIEL